MTLAKVLQFKPAEPVVTSACRWSEVFEAAAQQNLRIAFAWQRMFVRAFSEVFKCPF